MLITSLLDMPATMMMTGIGKSHQIGNLMISYDQLEEVQRLIKQAQESKSDVFALNGTIRLSDKDGTIVGYLTYDAETQTWGLAPPVVTPPSPNLTYSSGSPGRGIWRSVSYSAATRCLSEHEQ